MPLVAALAAALSAVLCAPLSAQAPAADAPFDCSDSPLDAPSRALLQKAGDAFTDACGVTGPDGRRLSREQVKAALGAGKTQDRMGKAPADSALSGEGARKVTALSKSAAGLDAAGLGKTFDGGAGGEADAAALSEHYGVGGKDAKALLAFSAAINADAERTISAYPAGNEVLDRLKDAHDVRRLPPVIIVDLGGGSIDAQYAHNDGHPAMELDLAHVRAAALAAAPDAERARLKREWSDPVKLSAALSGDPTLRSAVISSMDTTMVHELTHAWQDRRDKPVDLAGAGMKESVDCELEAYREAMLYFHQKVLRDPSQLDRDFAYADVYGSLLAGYDRFHDEVVGLYQGIASGSYPEVAEALARRKDGATKAVEARANASLYARSLDGFLTKLPDVQKHGLPLVVSHYESAGHPEKALALLTAASDAERSARGPEALAATLAALKADPPAAIEQRLDDWQAYLAYLQKTTGSNTMPQDLFALYQRDYKAAYDAKLAEASAARTAKARREALEWARSYAQFLPSPDKERLLKRLTAGAAK